ncbi:MAG TPA: glycoside hydrolase family 15 protein [Candidatus Saccharimonadales bacterium]|jgi:GH15 family glucan-1,4-alpha-glucosidase|nr:glycoside hydrolase family 15 protein [Candidatus Saccharimonadales bacterium]
MGRPVVLSNGQLFVGLDENGLVHDFYYPYVGLDNMTNARSATHKIGVWVDGSFHWVGDGSWETSVNVEPDALISDITLRSPELHVTLQFKDFIDPEYNALIRRVTITNDDDKQRDIRIFMHQVFQISRAGRADTALFVPDDDYILDYKGRCCLLIAGRHVDSAGKGEADFDQFAVGNYGIEGKAGTYLDAEDGELSGNAVEHGGVDSVLRFRKQVEPHESFRIDYWIVAADSQSDAQVIHTHIKYYSIDDRLVKAREYWQKWLEPAKDKLAKLPEEDRIEAQKSVLIIKAHCDDRGSVLASGDSSIFNFGRDYYCYCWPRDASYAIWPLIRLGLYDEARNFFEFARGTMHRDGYLAHKYQPDRSIGSTWHPLLHGNKKELAIQEDETAMVIFMLGEYHRASGDSTFIEGFYDNFIEPCAAFMADFVDEATGLPHASYDLWEQKFLTNTYTVCTVIAALETAIELAAIAHHPEDAAHWKDAADRMRAGLQALYHPDGYFRKGFLLQDDGNLAYDDTLDISSLYGPLMFAQLPLDDPRLASTFEAVKRELWNTSPIGGVIRYPQDNYFLAKIQYKGNPWIVCTLWLAQYFNAAGQPDQAKELLAWALKRSLPSGSLSEQFDPDTGFAISVTPLVWSHAEFVNTSLDIAKID